MGRGAISIVEARAEIGRSLSAASALLFPEQKLAVFFSPKAAASSIINWYLRASGVAHLALDSRTRFGAGKYELMMLSQMRPAYRAALEDLKFELEQPERKSWKLLKIVRNPYDRAISAFLMVMLLRNHKLSFREFLALPSGYFQHYGDGHARVQYSPLERLGLLNFDQIYKVEEGVDKILRDIELEYGLSSSLDSNANLYANRSNYVNATEVKNAADLCICSEHLKCGGAVPPRQAFLDGRTRERIYLLYEDDFRAYGYDRELEISADLLPDSVFTDRAKEFHLDELTGGLYSCVRKLPAGSRIMLYGLSGLAFELVMAQADNPQRLVAIADRSAVNREHWHPLLPHNFQVPLLSPEEIIKHEFDYLVITLQSNSKEIAELLANLGVPRERIISVGALPEFTPLNMLGGD